MACRVSEGKGWGPSKTCPLPIWKPFGSRFAHTRRLRLFFWGCGKGGGRSKCAPCQYVNRLVRPATTLTHNLSCARARQGRVQCLSRAACKPAVQPSNPKHPEKRRGVGAMQSLPPCMFRNPIASHSRKKSGMEKQSSSTGWGGRRKGAGRPVGSRNKPSPIRGLPETDCPLQWLLALVNHEGAPMRVRVSAAKALLPYLHPRR